LGEDTSPEEFFGLDERENLPVEWHRIGSDKAVVVDESGLEEFRRSYDPADKGRLPGDWKGRLAALRERRCALEVSPWAEGFFQVLGISNGASLVQALVTLCDRPDLAESQMEHYAWFLEEMLDRTLPGAEADYALSYVPIASNHAPVISPRMYRRFVLPAMSRVSERLEKHGVRHRFVYSSGAVESIIPILLDAGINGLVLTHAARCGLHYTRLRRDFTSSLLFFGGVDWRAVMKGPEAVDRELEENTKPLLEQGGYVPHLDDTVRENMPFENYRYYRDRLDELVQRVFG
jgi:uroporphyrinogen decarboxylase